MAMSEKLKNITKEDWRKLGFYYERDDEKNKWVFIGSKYGLEDFCIILDNYSTNTKNTQVGEHAHFGPYEYLKIMTSTSFKVTADSICGHLNDLKRLSVRLKKEIEDSEIGAIKLLESDFFQVSEYRLELRIMEYGYDPAKADSQLWE